MGKSSGLFVGKTNTDSFFANIQGNFSGNSKLVGQNQGNIFQDNEKEKICEPYNKHQVYESYWKPKIPKNPLPVIAEYKMVIIGEGGVGKTALARRILGEEFEKKYIATMGAEMSSLNVLTNFGLIKFSIWDTAGQEKLGGLREGYYLGAHCAIIMFDLTSRITYKNIPRWNKDLRRVCDNIPTVLVGNKVEAVKFRKIDHKDIRFHQKEKTPYLEISTKTGYQCEKPLLYLLKMLQPSYQIKLLEESVPQPEEHTTLTEEEFQNLMIEGENAEDTPLPANYDKEFGDITQEKDE